MSATIIGKEKIYSHFKRQEVPYWKLTLYNDKRSVVSSNFTDKNASDSLEMFKDVVENINTDQLYSLDMYDNGEEGRKGVKPQSSVCFAIAEVKQDKKTDHISPENKNFDSAAFTKNIQLIEDNAKLQVEVSIYKRHNEELVKEIETLKKYIQELEEDLDEEDEEDEEAIGASKSDVLMEALSGLIKSHGGAMVESLTGLRGDKKQVVPEQQAPVMNGTEDEIPEYDEIITRLEERDEKLQEHLYKLMLIAEQKPEMFKMLIASLENIN